MYHRIAKLISHLKYYPRLQDKLLCFYNILLISRKLRWVPFPWRQQPMHIVVRGHANPFAVRLGTTDWLVLVEIFLDGEYAEVASLLKDSHPALIVDLGSNVGFSIRYWLDVFPDAKVIAVEPDAENCAMIQRNIALCRPINFPEVIQACIVGQPRESVLFETASGREWAYAITDSESPTTRMIPAVTIEQILADHAITVPIDLLKCDIEGGEVELFSHCDSWIHCIGAAIIEVHGGFLVSDLINLLRDKGATMHPRTNAKQDLCIFTQVTPQ